MTTSNFQVLRLHIDFSESCKEKSELPLDSATAEKSGFLSLRTGMFAGVVALTGIGIVVYLKRSNT